MQCAKVVILILAMTVVASVATGADLAESYDLSIKTGAYGGLITRPKTNQELEDPRLRFGGILTGLGLNHALTENSTIIAQVSLVTDVKTKQLVRQGIDWGVAYHLLGGSRLVKEQTGVGSLTWRNPYNLSFVLLGGFHQYAVSNPDDTSESIEGSSFDTNFGLQYRQDVGNQAIGFEVLFSLVPIPSGVERVAAQGAEFSLFWRFLL
jgi:hypothetical protein